MANGPDVPQLTTWQTSEPTEKRTANTQKLRHKSPTLWLASLVGLLCRTLRRRQITFQDAPLGLIQLKPEVRCGSSYSRPTRRRMM